MTLGRPSWQPLTAWHSRSFWSFWTTRRAYSSVRSSEILSEPLRSSQIFLHTEQIEIGLSIISIIFNLYRVSCRFQLRMNWIFTVRDGAYTSALRFRFSRGLLLDVQCVQMWCSVQSCYNHVCSIFPDLSRSFQMARWWLLFFLGVKLGLDFTKTLASAKVREIRERFLHILAQQVGGKYFMVLNSQLFWLVCRIRFPSSDTNRWRAKSQFLVTNEFSWIDACLGTWWVYFAINLFCYSQVLYGFVKDRNSTQRSGHLTSLENVVNDTVIHCKFM